MKEEIDGRSWSHLSPEGQKAPTVREAIEYKSKLRLKLRKAEKNSQFKMVSRELSESPVWLALIWHPKAMAAFWFLVGQLHQNAGDQDDGLVCRRRQFKLWCGGRGDDHGAGEGLLILEQLGLVDVVFAGELAANPRYSKPRRYVLTTSPYQGNPRSNRWRSPECQSYASALLASKRSTRCSGVTAMFKVPRPASQRPRPPTPTQNVDSGCPTHTVKPGRRVPHAHRDRGAPRTPSRGAPRTPSRGAPRTPSRGAPRTPSKLNGAHTAILETV